MCERGFPILVNRTYQRVLYFSSKASCLPRHLIRLSSFSPGLLSSPCRLSLPQPSAPLALFLLLISVSIHSLFPMQLYFSITTVTPTLAGVDTVLLKKFKLPRVYLGEFIPTGRKCLWMHISNWTIWRLLSTLE